MSEEILLVKNFKCAEQNRRDNATGYEKLCIIFKDALHSLSMINWDRLYFSILLASICAYSLTFMGYNYTHMNALAIISMALVAFGVVVQKRIDFDMAFLFLFEGMLLVAIKSDRNYEIYDTPICIFIVMGYLLGKLAVGRDPKEADKRIMMTYFTMALSMAAMGVVNVVYTFWTYYRKLGFEFNSIFTEIFSREYQARTSLDLFFILTTSVFVFVAFLYREKKLILVLAFGIEILIQCIDYILRGRWNLIILLISIFTLAVVIVYEQVNSNQKSEAKRERIICYCGIVAFIIFVLSQIFRHVPGNSYLADDGGIIHNIRFQAILETIKNIPQYPFGGYKVETLKSSHCMWLEYQRHFGTFVCVCVLLFVLLITMDVIRIFFDRKIGIIKCFLIPAFIFLNIYHSLEPNAFDNKWWWMFDILLCGMIRAKFELSSTYISRSRKIKRLHIYEILNKIFLCNTFQNIELVILCIVSMGFGLFYDAINMNVFCIVMAIYVIFNVICYGSMKFDMAFLVIIQASIILFYLSGLLFNGVDYDKVIPIVLSYLCGLLCVRSLSQEGINRKLNVVMISLLCGLLGHGIFGVYTTQRYALLGSGTAVTPWLKIVLDDRLLVFDFVCGLSFIVIAVVCLILKMYKGLFAIVPFGVAIGYIVKINGSRDLEYFITRRGERLYSTLLAFKLVFIQPRGNFKITLGSENTSYNVWLDFARDYGIILWGLFVVFCILILISAIKIMVDIKNQVLGKYVLVSMFVLILGFFLLEKYARYYVIYLCIWMFISGLISFQCKSEKQ